MLRYQVVVSDVGIVHQGESLSEAVKQYGVYVLRSVNGGYGFVKKTVTLLEDKTVVMQYAWKE
jgi:hypothetical protein